MMNNLKFRFPFILKTGVLIKRIFRNIKFLFTHNLNEIGLTYDVEILKHELLWELPRTKAIVVKSIDETFEMLIHTNKSFCRFGDGEFENILLKSTPFSSKNLEQLSQRLIEVLSSRHSHIAIGLPLRMYEGKNQVLFNEMIYWRRPFVRAFYKVIEEYCQSDQPYYASEVTLPFCYENTNFNDLFKKARQIWQDKDITLIAGKGIFQKFRYDIFDNAGSVQRIDAPNKNAFAQYDSILKEALKIKKNRLVIIILGQTATVLAYDLALRGYRAIDFGHLAKVYDWYCKNKKAKIDHTKFFLPD